MSDLPKVGEIVNMPRKGNQQNATEAYVYCEDGKCRLVGYRKPPMNINLGEMSESQSTELGLLTKQVSEAIRNLDGFFQIHGYIPSLSFGLWELSLKEDRPHQ